MLGSTRKRTNSWSIGAAISNYRIKDWAHILAQSLGTRVRVCRAINATETIIFVGCRS